MAHVDGEGHLSGHGVRRRRLRSELRRGDTHKRSAGCGQLIDTVQRVRQCAGGVASTVHRRGASVGREALEGHLEPSDSLHAGDDPDRGAAGLEDRSLLDVQLQVGAQRPAQWRGACPSQAVELGADRDAGAVGERPDRFEVRDSGPHCGAHHRHREAGAFLVGPHRHFDGRAGADRCVVEGLDDLQAAEHAVYAVEASSGRLGVEMAAQHDRRSVGIGPRSSGEQVSDDVELDRAARMSGPGGEQVAACFVVVGERLAVGAPAGGRADLGHCHQTRPKSAGVGADCSDHRRPPRSRGPAGAESMSPVTRRTRPSRRRGRSSALSRSR